MDQADTFSPEKHIDMIFNNSESCFSFHSSPNNWTNSSLCHLDCLSPGGSTMSFSLSSPPYHITPEELETPIIFTNKEDELCVLNSTFSPSIFSPHQKEKMQCNLLKKRCHSAQREIVMDEKFLLLSDDSLFRKACLNTSRDSSGDCKFSHFPDVSSTPAVTSGHLPSIITPGSTVLNLKSNNNPSSSSSTDLCISSNLVVQVTPPVLSSVALHATMCNCKKSKCLKLYCDCFAALNYCDPLRCNCLDCANNTTHESVRRDAIQTTKDRNSSAFVNKAERKGQFSGCNCKNSHCLKKYCECFNGGSLCSSNCKCQSCQNFKNSSSLTKAKDAIKATRADSSIIAVKRQKTTDDPVSGVLRLNHSPSSGVSNSVRFASLNTQLQSRTLVSRGPADQPRRVQIAKNLISYAFFGPRLPETSKIIALKCLDYLVGSEIYFMSQVNTLWAQVAVDDALWE